MDLTQLTPTELRKMDKEAIIQAILEGQTHTQSSIERDGDGNQLRQEDLTYDAYTGGLVGQRVVTWTYYPNGVVDTIVVNDGKEELTIKHAKEGKVLSATRDIVVGPKPIEEPIGRRL